MDPVRRPTDPAPLAPPTGEAPSRREQVVAGVLLGVTLLLRVLYAFRWRVDSDELQHLHVAWAWTQGLVQYRDVFDNHMPLFHVLMAPFVALVGEGAGLVIAGRLAMLPLFAGTLYALYRVARSCFGARAALFGTAFAAATQEIFVPSLETRADDLWALFCVGATAVLLGGRLDRRRALLAGTLVAGAFATSMKTSLVVAAFGGAAVEVWLVLPGTRRAWPLRRAFASLGLLAAPVVVGMALLMLGAVALDAGPAFFRCAFEHNYVPGSLGRTPLRVAAFAGGLLVLAGGTLVARRAAKGALSPEALWIVLGAILHELARKTVWVATSRQDGLPTLPLLAVAAVAGVLALRRRAEDRAKAPANARRLTEALLVGLVVLSWGRLLWNQPPWRDGTVGARAYLADALRLVRPGEPILDPKGQTVFRRRATRLVFERFTRARIDLGLLEDTVARDVVASRTCVAAASVARYSDATKRFLAGAFVPVGRVLVAGSLVDATAAGAQVRVSLAIAAEYAVVSDDGRPFTGTLDGTPYVGPRALGAGDHDVVPSAPFSRWAVVWARAIEEGFSPFAAAMVDADGALW